MYSNAWKSASFVYNRQMNLNYYFHSLCDLIYNPQQQQEEETQSSFYEDKSNSMVSNLQQELKFLIEAFVHRYSTY